jgi:hypothetical protein
LLHQPKKSSKQSTGSSVTGTRHAGVACGVPAVGVDGAVEPGLPALPGSRTTIRHVPVAGSHVTLSLADALDVMSSCVAAIPPSTPTAMTRLSTADPGRS